MPNGPREMRNRSLVVIGFFSLGVALYAVVAYGVFPLGALVHPDMRVSFNAHKLAIYSHIFAASIALSLGPFQFSSQLRTKHLTLHRWLGRCYLGAGVCVGGIAGLYSAMFAFGGLLARAGFACLALTWLYTGLRAYLAVRKRDIVSHQRWMTRNFALTFAAVTLRIYLGSSRLLGIDFEFAYPVIAWLCWVPNLLVAETLIATAHNQRLERTRG
jgi:uncharacterized membrane protein